MDADPWAPILPAPHPLPETIRHPRLGTPSRVWRYRDAAGRLLFAVVRFDPPGARKEILPMTCGTDGWRWKAPPEPRPLFGLPDLAARPDALVIGVEGERTTEAAARLFPDHVAVTWPGGAQASNKADWRPLRGRVVAVWPDNDEPGRKAAETVARACRAAGAAGVGIVDVPRDWPEGWDLADPLPPGVTHDRLRDMLAGAQPAAGEPGRPQLRIVTIRAPEPAERLRDAPWTDPDMSLLDREPIPAPAWPRDLFPGDWGHLIDMVADARGCPPDFVGLAVLSALAARIGNARWGQPWPGWREPTTLWVAVVGAPSSGKSPGLDAAAEALGTIEAEANHDWEERCRAYRTRREEAKAIRDRWLGDVKAAAANGTPPPDEPRGAREPDPPARRRVMTTDPTIEKAGRLSADNPRGLLLLRDELAGWLGGMDRYGGGAGADRAFWLQSYGGRRWQPDRVKDGDRGVEVPHLSWNILGSIQPDRTSSLLLAGDDDGLAARLLYAWPAPRQPTRPQHAPAGGHLLAALRRLEALPWTPPEPVALPFTADAADAMQAWREEIAAMEAEASGVFLSWLGKGAGFALRLAVVFAHLEWLAREGGEPPAEVDADAMARACGFLAEYAIPMARRVFGAAALPEAERDARRLARWIMRQSPRPAVVNARALRRMSDGPGIQTTERLEAAFAELEAAGWCRPAPARAGEAAGRQRKDWAINPALLGRPAR